MSNLSEEWVVSYCQDCMSEDITCIRPAMLYGSETWPTKIEDIRKIQRSEMRILRWMTGVSLSERKSNECVRSMLAIDNIGEVMQQKRLRWFEMSCVG